jgi:hypothetical protein
MGQKDIKITGPHKAAKQMQKVEVAYAQSSFVFLETILDSMKKMLVRIAWWNLAFDENNRKDTYRELDEVIENLELEIKHLSFHKGMGNIIANSLYNAATDALSYAKTMQSMCKTGNFQNNGWNVKKKMFDDFRAKFDTRVNFIIAAYKQGTQPTAQNEVLDILMKEYVNKYHDSIGEMQKGAYQ